MRIVKTLAGGLVGGIAGFLIGVFVACKWLYPSCNLCGLLGVFITGPLGWVTGMLVGWYRSRPLQDSSGDSHEQK